MSTEQRAEIRSSGQDQRIQTRPPKWMGISLASILAAGGIAYDHFIHPQIVEAADPQCRVGVRIESYRYFDMAQILHKMGRRHILDMGIDPRAGSTAGFTVDAVPVTYKAGDREKPGFKPLASTTIVRDQKDNVGRGELRFTAPCNTTTVTSEGRTVPAIKFKLTSNLEGNDQYEQVVGDGRRVPVFFGSEIKKPEDFLRIADTMPEIVKDLSPKTLQSIREQVRQAVQKLEEAQRTEELERRLKAVEGRVQEQPAEGQAELEQPQSLYWDRINQLPVVGWMRRAGEVVVDLPAKAVDRVTEPDTRGPVRWGIDLAGWLVALGALAIAFDRPRAWLQRIRLNHPRTRIWNTVAWLVREARYQLGPRRAYGQGLANQPVRRHPGPWSA